MVCNLSLGAARIEFSAFFGKQLRHRHAGKPRSNDFIAIDINITKDTERAQIINTTNMVVMDMRNQDAIYLSERQHATTAVGYPVRHLSDYRYSPFLSLLHCAIFYHADPYFGTLHSYIPTKEHRPMCLYLKKLPSLIIKYFSENNRILHLHISLPRIILTKLLLHILLDSLTEL